MTTTQQHEYKIIIKAFEQRNGAGSWANASKQRQDEYAADWMDGYNEKLRWAPLDSTLSSQEEDLLDIVRTLLIAVDRHDKTDENDPSPIANDSPVILAARRACVERGFTAGGMAIGNSLPIVIGMDMGAGSDQTAYYDPVASFAHAKTHDQQQALMEGERIESEDEYFCARPQLDFIGNRRIFESGFQRGFARALLQKAGSCGRDAKDAERLDVLSDLVEEAFVGSSFDIDGGIHLTIEAPSTEPVAYRNMDNLRAAIDAHIAATNGET